MNKLYYLLCGCFLWMVSPAIAQVVIEDFEGGTADLMWTAPDGTYNGVVPNPAPMSLINSSGFAGSYTKDSLRAFSLFLADLAAPIQLTQSTNQLFIDIYASKDTRVIVKLEGTGPAIEGTANIPVANQWRRYRFDFSAAAANTTFTKIILFFDYGNTGDKGTYIYDNITLGSSPCAGVARDLTIVDDFECQRAPIRAGIDSLTVVPNPAPDAVNGPGPVGRWSDPEGGFAALVYNYDDSINLEATPILKLKYYAPIANRLLVKLEGGTSPGREIGVDVTEVNEWQEYAFDFSAFADGNYRSLTIFTNAGQNAPGVVYYFDDIRFEAKALAIIEDFEGATPNLFWQPKSNNSAVNGTFSVVANPDPSGLNTTAKVGAHTKGSAALSTIVALLPSPLDLSTASQLNMLIYAPAGSQKVRLSAISASRGRLDIERDITATGQWVEVGFNLEDFKDATDINSLELVFDPTLTGARTYYFDQLSLGAGTIDPCEGTVPVANLIDDFECQRNVTITNGASELMIVKNPDTDGNPSEKVGKYTDPDDEFSALTYTFDTPIDGSVFNNIVVDIWAPKIVPLGFKLEGSTNGSPAIEKVVQAKSAMMWERYRISVPEAEGRQYTKLSIFFNFAVKPGTATDVYYIDNLSLARGPVTACIVDFESPNTTITDFRSFGQGASTPEPFAVVPNPNVSARNGSSTVGRFTEGSDGMSFQGIFSPFGAPVVFPNPNNKTIRIKVLAPDTLRFVMKLERGVNNVQTGDVFPVTPYTTPGQWQELTYDFSSFDTDAAQYSQITLIPGIGFVPSATREIYFDDIVIGDASCPGTVSTREERRAITDMHAYPNPSRDQLYLEVPAGTRQVRVMDALGRTLLNQASGTADQGGLMEMSVAEYAPGFYTAVAFDAKGVALARVRLSVTH